MEKPPRDESELKLYLSGLRHDIRNQLSNIQLSVEELKHEMPGDSPDIAFYIATIVSSCEHINSLLKDKE
jgi:signal transduction histidine kinase